MMRVLVFAVLLVLLGPAPVAAQEHVLTVDLAQSHVDITTGFDGASLSVFGVKNQSGDVVVVLRGPEQDFVVRQKERVGGAWLNRRSVLFHDVPQFYDYATNADVTPLLPVHRLKEEKIGPEALRFVPVEEGLSPEDIKVFQDSLIRNKQSQRLFPLAPKDIVFLSDTFFKTQFYVPSNVPTGHYVIETFLIDNQRIVDKRVTNLRVGQVGFSAGIYQFAHSYPFAYAMVVIVIAVLAGWLSNAVRRK